MYFRFLSGFRSGILPINRRVTWSWNPPNDLPMWGVTTQVSKPKSNTACTTSLKKNPETHGSDLSLLSIVVILFHITLARYKSPTTAVQYSSAAKVARSRYRKEVTISRGVQ